MFSYSSLSLDRDLGNDRNPLMDIFSIPELSKEKKVCCCFPDVQTLKLDNASGIFLKMNFNE